MSAITSNSEYWDGHTKVEVEDYIKSQFIVSAAGGIIQFYTPVIDTNGSASPMTSRKISVDIPGITSANENIAFFVRDFSAFQNNPCSETKTLLNMTTYTYYYQISVDGGNTYYPYIYSKTGTTNSDSESPLKLFVFSPTQEGIVYTNGTATQVTGCWMLLELTYSNAAPITYHFIGESKLIG